ncbi:putative spore protein YtfJ [Catenibacillus scindens]|uniref:Putative spore protein YtfJ n=1 Tax=Catenibacillus scindens TaxID=673271 RepID=A0A7W8HAN7_9FIRM|nr:GerW family sporulation protein [Catenibacillus scindens]MBB5264981.1 putative spore protein YtfJ [Catenibacillus scindens]
MAEKSSKFTTTVESLFKGMDSFISAKTVVGDVVTVKDTIIVPLVDVSFGVAAGAWEKSDKNSAGGGLGGKIKPAAVLVISNGVTRMIPVNQPQDMVSKIIDIVPELVNKFMPDKKHSDMDEDVKKAVDDIIDGGNEES